jgi:hypothetical protein
MEPTANPQELERTPSSEAEVERVTAQVVGQLAERGVIVHDDDTPEQLADILSAVERFEGAVQLRGGSSYTNAPQSSDPDRDEFVVPRRRDDEDAMTYVGRVRAAAEDLHPPPGTGGPHPGSAV